SSFHSLPSESWTILGNVKFVRLCSELSNHGSSEQNNNLRTPAHPRCASDSALAQIDKAATFDANSGDCNQLNFLMAIVKSFEASNQERLEPELPMVLVDKLIRRASVLSRTATQKLRNNSWVAKFKSVRRL